MAIRVSAMRRQERIMRLIGKSSAFVAVFLGLFVNSARAQEIVIAQVPFPFVVGHETLPAGQYEVRQSDDRGDILFIEGMNNKSSAFALTMSAGGNDPMGDRPVLVFTRRENEYRLSQIWVSSTEGRELPRPSGARRTGRAETQPGPSGEQEYVLAANLR
jgi:hypothetical protein